MEESERIKLVSRMKRAQLAEAQAEREGNQEMVALFHQMVVECAALLAPLIPKAGG